MSIQAEFSQTFPRNDLSSECVREMFNYDKETGYLSWAVDRNFIVKAGDIVNTKHNQGYIRVCVDYKTYLAHRIIWLFVYGEWPKSNIDHIDGDKTNNRIENLREATQQENLKNQSIRKNNTSGVLGVSFVRASNTWRAAITVNAKTIVLGHFESILDAKNARIAANVKYGFHANHGTRI